MGLLKELIKHQDPRYGERLRAQEAQQRQEQQNTENRRLLMQYLGSAGSPAVGAGNDFGDDHLAAQGVSLPGEIEAYGYLGSDRGDAARMRFASNLLSIPNSPEAQRVGGAALQQYMQPSREQELVGKLKEFQQAKQTGVIPSDMGYQDFLQLGKSPGVTVNTGGAAPRKHISREDAKNLIHVETGAHPTPEMYEDDVRKSGEYRFAGADAQKIQRGKEKGAQLYEDVARYIGKIPAPKPGFIANAVARVGSEYQRYAQESPEFANYLDYVDANIISSAKARGGTGDLSDSELSAERNRFPMPWDTESVRQEKLSMLARDGGVEMQSPQSSNIPPPPPGFTRTR